MHIRDQNQSLRFFLLAQFIVYTKVPIWVGSSKKGVLKGWVGLGTFILKRACSKGGTKEHMHTTILLPCKNPNKLGYLLCIDNPQKGHNKRNQGVEIFRFFFMMVVDVSQERDGCVAILFYQ